MAMKLNDDQMKNVNIGSGAAKVASSSKPDPLRQNNLNFNTPTPTASPSYDFSPQMSDPSIRRPQLPSHISLSGVPTTSTPATGAPSVDRASKPASCSSHFASSSGNLRVVNVPQRLTDAFLKCAETNNHRNHETCGILCGNLVCMVVTAGINLYRGLVYHRETIHHFNYPLKKRILFLTY